MKKNNYTFVLTLFSLIFTLQAFSQSSSIIRGRISDGETGEYLPFVNVVIQGTTTGTTSDFDGYFNLPVAPGIYNLQFSFVSYQTKIIQNVEVKENETKVLNNIILSSSMTQLQEVVVEAEMRKNNETALQTMKMKSATLLDGISSDNFRKMGDSDAAESMKRVPGVSVQDGKYIFVRGLGDRYTKTMLNGMDIPGLDPDRNTLQMDIFPTSILDNIVVHKTFVAELPADFTGGVIDINTKDFPSEKVSNLSISTAYGPTHHLRSDYLKYEGGSLDFLGMDDGNRTIPLTGSDIPLFTDAISDRNGPKGKEYVENLKKFNPNLAAFRANSFVDFGLSYDFGNQIIKGKNTIGYSFVVNYSNSTRFYKDVEYARYGINQIDPSDFNQDLRESTKGDLGTNEVMLSAMAGVSLKRKNAKYIFNVMRLQNGVSKAGVFNYVGSDQGAEFTAFQHNLDYSERALNNISLSGTHYLENTKWEFNWKLAPTLSSMNDPDIRFTRYETRNQLKVISTEAGLPERIWRELQETNMAAFTKATRNYRVLGDKAKLHVGFNYVYKNRDYNIRNFQFEVRGAPQLTGDPNELLSERNLWPVGDYASVGTTYNVPWLTGGGRIRNPNMYTSSANNAAAFVSTELNPFPKLRAIVGVRMEYFQLNYTGTNQQNISLNDSTVLQETKLFPSLNLVYALDKKQNLRFSYSNTVARPSFKELSYAEIYDPITGRTFVGGLFPDVDPLDGDTVWNGNLISTSIYNFDLRWEIFPSASRMVSFGVFYKLFDNPIEIVQYATQAGAFQPRNVGDGQVMGAEFELRQSFDFISKKLQNFNTVVNLTYTASSIELSPTERDSREENKRTGQTIGTHRDMSGQAPYIINVGLAFDGKYIEKKSFAKNLEAGIYYNVQGPTLIFAGIVDRPDIYSEPFHNLNLNINKRFGKDERMTAGFSVSNLLGDLREEFSVSYKSDKQIFTRFNPGRIASIKFGYRF